MSDITFDDFEILAEIKKSIKMKWVLKSQAQYKN